MMQSSPLSLSRVIIWAGRLIVGGIFGYAGYAKAFTPNLLLSSWIGFKLSVSSNLATFQLQVAAFKLLPPAGVSFLAHTLPFAELILGLFLIFGVFLRISATFVTLIVLGFLTVVTRAYLLHMNINCGCFQEPEPLTGYTVLRDVLIATLAVTMTILVFREAKKPHPWTASANS